MLVGVVVGERDLSERFVRNSLSNWPTDFPQLAPGVFAYIQAGGPGVPSVSVSNAGLIVEDDHTLVIDTLGAPIHAKNL